MKVLVVEEELEKINELKQILWDVDNGIHITGISPELLQSSEWFKPGNIPDLILVNTEIIKKEKTSLLSKGKVKTTVTLSTSSDEYSFHAFRFKALETLMKSKRSFAKLNPGLNIHKTFNQDSKGRPVRNRFLVKQGQKLLSVSTDDIAYFFSDSRFIFFKIMDGQKFLVEYRMDELEGMLDTSKFFRVTRSCIISIAAIKHIHPYFGNRLKLEVQPVFETDIIVSRERVNNFKTWLGE